MTLTEAAYWTRRFGVIALGAVAVFFIVTIVILNLGNDEVPSEYLTPNFACTETADQFTQNKIEIPSLELAAGSDRVFELETESGKVDALPRIINVHKFNILGQSLNSQAEAKIIAGKLGFDPERIQRRGATEYLWYDPNTYRTLVVQARNLNFVITTDFTKPSAIDRSATLPTENEAINIATNFLRGKGFLFEDYFEEKPGVVNINIEPDGSFTQSSSKAEAELVRVDFYRRKSIISVRSDITGSEQIKANLESRLPELEAATDSIVTDQGRVDVYNFNTVVTFENPSAPNISVYIGPQNELSKVQDTNTKYVYGVNFTYWPIDTFPCGTYQLIPPSVALEKVQKGEGSMVYLNEKNGDDVIPYSPKEVSKFTIYGISLGYYEPKSEVEFLQPIYIIEGEATLSSGVIGQVYFYVPAVDYDAVRDKVIEEAPVEEDSGGLF